MLSIYFKPKVSVKLKRFGSNRDGGYFVPVKIVKNIKKIISCGLGSDWSFEEHFIKKNRHAKIIFYDHTIGIFFWIKNFLMALYYFLRYGSNFRNVFKFIYYKIFIKNQNIKHKKLKISKKNNFSKKEISLKEILENETNNLLLKIDIEGSEYKILNDILKYEKKIDCLIIEFHKINKYSKNIKNFIKRLSKLKNCNISPNNSSGFDKFGNPNTIELVFINKSYLSKLDYKRKITIKSFPNNPYKVNYKINFKG